MSNLTTEYSQQVARYVNEALSASEFCHADGSINYRKAATVLPVRLRGRLKRGAAVSEATRARTPDADRRLIERVCKGASKSIRTTQAQRLLLLVACIGKSENVAAGRLWHTIQRSAKREYDAEALFLDGGAFSMATGDDVVALRLVSWSVEDLIRDLVVRDPHGDGPNSRWWYRGHIARAKRLLVTAPISSSMLAALAEFERAALADGHPPSRVIAAIRRLLGPLCAWERTRGRCLGWHQMSKPARKRAFYGGLAVEKAWLEKPST